MLALLSFALLAAEPLRFVEPADDVLTGRTLFRLETDIPQEDVLGLELFIGERSVAYFDQPPYEAEIDLDKHPAGETELRAVLSPFIGDPIVARLPFRNIHPDANERVTLLRIPVHVISRQGPPPPLSMDDFQVREDGATRELKYLMSERQPLHLVILIDLSGSMSRRWLHLRRGIFLLLEGLSPEDKVKLVGFNHDVFELSDFDTDKQALQDRLRTLEPEGGTNLHGAIWSGIRLLGNHQQRRAVVVFTDGSQDLSDVSYSERNLEKSEEDCIQLANELGVPVYTMGIGTGVDEEVLTRIAEETGGVFHPLTTWRGLRESFEALAGSLRHQYLLCFYGRNEPGPRAIEVQLTHDADLQLRYPTRLRVEDR